MKIDRIIGIITLLQRRGKTTMPYLAEKFEVSRRTIARDIEDICRAGIPIVTSQGADGGIEIMEGFNLDTTVFTKEELQTMFAGIKALESVSAVPSSFLADKLYSKKNVIPITENMMIDLSSFFKDSLSEKIELLKKAAHEQRTVKFRYYYNKGEADKEIDPILIVFKWSSWYVFGFCHERNDFRLYKLNRLWDLTLTEERFEKREIPAEKLNFGKNITDEIKITAIYEASEKYKLVEEYGPYSFKVTEDGRLYTEWGFSCVENAMSWFLSFGAKVEILEPADFKETYEKEIKRIIMKLEM